MAPLDSKNYEIGQAPPDYLDAVLTTAPPQSNKILDTEMIAHVDGLRQTEATPTTGGGIYIIDTERVKYVKNRLPPGQPLKISNTILINSNDPTNLITFPYETTKLPSAFKDRSQQMKQSSQKSSAFTQAPQQFAQRNLENFLDTLNDEELAKLWKIILNQGKMLKILGNTTESDKNSMESEKLLAQNTSNDCILYHEIPQYNTDGDLFNPISPHVLTCAHWRWPDLILQQDVYSIKSSQELNINQLNAQITPNPKCSLFSNFRDSEISKDPPARHCINPYHWSKLTKIDYPPPPYVQKLDAHSHFTDLQKIEKPISRAIEFDNTPESTETGGTCQNAGSVVPLHIRQHLSSSRHHSNPLSNIFGSNNISNNIQTNPPSAEPPNNQKPREWCALARWEYRALIGGQYLVTDPVHTLHPYKLPFNHDRNHRAVEPITPNPYRDNFRPSTSNITFSLNDPIDHPKANLDDNNIDSEIIMIALETQSGRQHSPLYQNSQVYDLNNHVVSESQQTSLKSHKNDLKSNDDYRVYLYNEMSTKALFVDSSQIAALNQPLTSTAKIKVPPGHCIKLYDSHICQNNNNLTCNTSFVPDSTFPEESTDINQINYNRKSKFNRSSPVPRFPTIRFSVGKGWGPGYTRTFIESCPVWYEMTLFLGHENYPNIIDVDE